MIRFEADLATLHRGDVIDELRELEAGSVHCVVTSPPYYGLRSYGIPPRVWGGRDGCRHKWGDPLRHGLRGTRGQSGAGLKQVRVAEAGRAGGSGGAGQFCKACGGWSGTLGNEPQPWMFVDHLVEVFREVRRVLRPDGILWLNLGDCHSSETLEAESPGYRRPSQSPMASPIVKERDLVGIPWAAAFALRADGWALRAACPWIKPNAQPEPVRDRPTTGHEYLFQLTPGTDVEYWTHTRKRGRRSRKSPPREWEWVHRDTGAVSTYPPIGNKKLAKRLWFRRSLWSKRFVSYDPDAVRKAASGSKDGTNYDARNRRTSDTMAEAVEYWADTIAALERGDALALAPDGSPAAFTVNVGSCSAAHFAVFPSDLVVPCVLSSTSHKGACPTCLAPYHRVVEVKRSFRGDWMAGKRDTQEQTGRVAVSSVGGAGAYSRTTVGHLPTCACEWVPPVPCTVLDPFSGTGTTMAVAVNLGRNAVGIEVSEDFCAIATDRLRARDPRRVPRRKKTSPQQATLDLSVDQLRMFE